MILDSVSKQNTIVKHKATQVFDMIVVKTIEQNGFLLKH